MIKGIEIIVSIELRVVPRQQRSIMSCWWAGMAMILAYYGQHHPVPWTYREAFRRPLGRPSYPIPDVRFSSETYNILSYDPPRYRRMTGRQIQEDRRLRLEEVNFIQPYEWYDRGLPSSRNALRFLTEITGFKSFSRPAFGEWTAEDFELRLRRYGPYLFLGRWEGEPHAIVVVGLHQTSNGAEVISIDPALPDNYFAAGESLSSFNNRMRLGLDIFQRNPYNPLYFPQRNPVREVVDLSDIDGVI